MGTESIRWGIGIVASTAGVLLAILGLYELVRVKPPTSMQATARDFSQGLTLDRSAQE